MENQMYLTPSQVEELRELGVEFKGLETSCSWLLDSVGTWTIENTETAQWYHATPDSIYEKIICAPSLQEVLEKLPAVLTIREECGDYADNECEIYSLVMNWDYIAKVWYCCYADYGNDALYGADSFCDPNPLLAAYELLLWVAKTYPESLTDKTE